MPSAPQRSPAKSTALENGLAIVELLANAHDQPLSLSEISATLELPQASALRLLRSLCHTGYVQRDPTTKRYTLTNRLSGVGARGQADRSLMEAAIAPLRHLRDETGETAQLVCLHDRHSVMLDQYLSNQPFKFMGDLGSRVSWHLCAPGKAMVAALDDDSVAHLIETTPFTKVAPRSIASPQEAWQHIRQVRQAGFAMDDEEHIAGVRCIGAAICDLRGRLIGGITIAGFKSRFEGPLLEDRIAAVLRAKRHISQLIQS